MENSMVKFNFNSDHNGINCIESTNPEDKGTSRQVWFTRQMLADIFQVTVQTIANKIQGLLDWKEIHDVKNFTSCNIPTETGAVKTTLYDLTVFNKLAFEIKSDVAREMRSKFSDILSEVETTGQYSLKPKDSFMIEDPIERAKAWIAEQEEHRKQIALANEQTAQALEREAQAIRTKAQINDKKTATALGRVGGLVKENNNLKEQLSLAGEYRTILAVANKNHLRDQKYISWRRLKTYCVNHGLPIKEIPDARFGTVKTYPVEAFQIIYPELIV